MLKIKKSKKTLVISKNRIVRTRTVIDDWLIEARRNMRYVESTKNCPCCYTTNMACYRSYFLKACHHCMGNDGKTVWLYWPLSDCQKPLIKHQRG